MGDTGFHTFSHILEMLKLYQGTNSSEIREKLKSNGIREAACLYID